MASVSAERLSEAGKVIAMIIAKDEKTRKFLERLKKQEQKDRDLRRRAKKDRVGMRLARVVYGVDGSVTSVWRND